jgi:hypothetical protein
MSARDLGQVGGIQVHPGSASLRTADIWVLCFSFDYLPFCFLQPERLWIDTEHAAAMRDAYPISEGHCLEQ